MIEGFKGYRGSERGVKETIVLYLKVNVKALKIKGGSWLLKKTIKNKI